MDNKFKNIAVVYLGSGDTCKALGSVTGSEYIFKKNESRMPLPTNIDERDLQGFLGKRGKKNERLFMSSIEWNLALEEGVASNSL